MSNIPSLILNTNDRMPLLGLGVYKATAPGEVEGAIAAALDCGYRLIDTASAYKNEEGVGWHPLFFCSAGGTFHHDEVMEYRTADR